MDLSSLGPLFGGLGTFLSVLITALFKYRSVKRARAKANGIQKEAEPEPKTESIGMIEISGDELETNIRNSVLFGNLYKYTVSDIKNMYDLTKPKDVQFYILMILKYTIFNNNIKRLTREVVSGEIDEITVEIICDLHYKSIDEYTGIFHSIGGSPVLSRKLNLFHEKTMSRTFIMVRDITNLVIADNNMMLKLLFILISYNQMFNTTIDDAMNTYASINGELDRDCEARGIKPELILQALSNVIEFDKDPI